ncbi:hypothetical protein PMAYCL1PPCAC_25456, partial [Pristionchus mayeri]
AGGEHTNITKERCFNCDSVEHRSSECPKQMEHRFCIDYDREVSVSREVYEVPIRGHAHNVFCGRGFRGRG